MSKSSITEILERFPAPKPAPAPQPGVGPNNQTTDFPSEEPQDEGSEENHDFLVIISSDDGETVELTAVVAPASRFARRAAAREWKAAGNSVEGFSFNARRWDLCSE